MEQIKKEFVWIRFLKNYADTEKKALRFDKQKEDALAECVHRARTEIKRLYAKRRDPLRPLMTNWRAHDWHVRYDEENWDSWTEYALFPDNGETEEELREIERDLTVTIHSAYDCTGKPFTNWVDAKRCPAGIIVIRSWSLDV